MRLLPTTAKRVEVESGEWAIAKRLVGIMASKAWYKPSALPQLIARFDPPSTPEHASKKAIEVWTTTCIVTNFGKCHDDRHSSPPLLPQCTTLINPANPNLTGPNSFPYFPRGGPQPALQPNRHAHHIMGYVSQWGGMDVGSGLLFSAEAIDGLVHQLGGMRLRAECSLVHAHKYSHAYVNQQTTDPEVKNDNDNITTNTLGTEDMQAKCPVGTAVMTPPGGDELRKHYDSIIHTTPPFYRYPPLETKELKEILGIKEDEGADNMHSWSRELLRSCYRQSFDVAFDNNTQVEDQENSFFRGPLRLFGFNKPTAQQISKRVAVPLLGAGCRAFPRGIALEVAALEGASWLSELDVEQSEKISSEEKNTVVFGLLENADAEELSDKIEKLL